MRNVIRFLRKAGCAVFLCFCAATFWGADLPKTVYLVPNFHPACCGWLADWSTERNYCANSYLDHLDRVRDDKNYAFAFSEVPTMIAFLNFHPDRVEELKQRIKEGRVELCNAFFLEPTINLSGGEALVKSGVEGLRWQTQVLGSRPRFAWMIDITGQHEQMAQITAGLGLDALFYCRHNPTGSAIHWVEAPDGTRVLAVSPGGYADWDPVFRGKGPLNHQQLEELASDLRARADSAAMKPGDMPRAPAGAPVFILGGGGDYSLAPDYKGYPAEFLQQFKEVAPGTDLRFSTPGKYVDAVLPGAKSGTIQLPTMRGGTAFSFNAFWIESPRVKSSYRRCEQQLQAAEMLSTIASLKAGGDYPAQSLYHAWLMMLLNMDRNSLWGSAGGMVFESDKSWDVRDRFDSVAAISEKALDDAMGCLLKKGSSIAFFNSLNWERNDPVLVSLPERRGLKDAKCQALPGGREVLCRVPFPSIGTASLETTAYPLAQPKTTDSPEIIKTKQYQVRIDPKTGALISLRLQSSGREMLGGPANVIVAEKPKEQGGDPGDHIVDRQQRDTVGSSSQFPPTITVSAGPLATTVEAVSEFHGGGQLRRVMRFYDDYPRVDFETELNDIPDRIVVVAEFPLAEEITEIRRGIPYGFSHGAWSKPNPDLHGWTKGIVPAVRWSHYTLAGGGGVALLDRGLSGRELTGKTPVIFLLNATDKYYGYPNSWLSGKGKHLLAYALVAHDAPWEKARIPQMAWEFNCPPVLVPNRATASAKSFVETSDNVIVEAVRREGAEIELRLAECLGRAGTAEVKLSLPHQQASLTDMLGKNPAPLKTASTYRFPVRPQQIVTMRFRAGSTVPGIKPLTDWNPLVPEAKRPALNTPINKKGHPPRGDE